MELLQKTLHSEHPDEQNRWHALLVRRSPVCSRMNRCFAMVTSIVHEVTICTTFLLRYAKISGSPIACSAGAVPHWRWFYEP